MVTCRTLLPLPALGEAGTAVPITQEPCTFQLSRGSEKFGEKPVDNGDIGNNNWNDFENAIRLPFRSPLLTSSGCLNHPLLLPSLAIFTALTRRSVRRSSRPKDRFSC